MSTLSHSISRTHTHYHTHVTRVLSPHDLQRLVYRALKRVLGNLPPVTSQNKLVQSNTSSPSQNIISLPHNHYLLATMLTTPSLEPASKA